jgi:prevent-host-death family protein
MEPQEQRQTQWQEQRQAERQAVHGVTVMNVTEFSANPSKAIRDTCERPVMIVKHSKPVAYVLSADEWATITRQLRRAELYERESLLKDTVTNIPNLFQQWTSG